MAEAIRAGLLFITLVRPAGHQLPQGWPRGELVNECHDGRRVYSYPVAKVAAYLCRVCAGTGEASATENCVGCGGRGGIYQIDPAAAQPARTDSHERTSTRLHPPA